MPQHSDRVKDKLREIEARELAVLKKIKTYRDGNLIEFFDRPNPLQEKLLDAWVNPLYKVFTFSGSNRLGKCLTYRTLIDTPQGRVSIGELYKAGKSFKVYAWNGKEKIVANANPPIKKKGLHKCYNLNMSNGDVPGCADYHRVLTSHGWFSVERLRASFGTLQGSSLVHDPLALISGDLHWNETERGSLAHCFHEFHQYGGRLLSLIGGGLFSSPLRGGVQPHNGLLCSSDALERIYKNTLQLISGLLSNLYGFHLVLGRYAGFLYHAVCRFLTLGGIYSQFVQRPIFESCLPFQSIGGFLGQANLKKGHPFLALHSFLCNSFGLLKRSNQVVQKPILKFSGQSPPIGGFDQLTKNVYHDNVASYEPPFRIIGNNQIESITPISSRQEVYDFEVPGYKNYFAGGIVHHNTTIGTVIAFATLFGYWPWGKKEKLKFPHTKPRKVRYIGQDWEKQIKTVLVPELEKWWPDNRVVSKKKNNQGIDAFWTDELTGSTLELMSNGQEPELHEGWSGDLIIFDEPCKRKIRIANARGLIDRQGRELFCMTLLKEAWISREIIKAVDENGCPDPTVFNVSGDISNNVGFGITQEGVDQFVKTLTPDEYDARIRGIPSYMSGLVYPSFSREKHIKQRFKIPLDWVIDIAIDVHPRVEQAILFCAVSPRGDKYLCNEIWEHGDGTWVGEEIIRCINFCKYRVGSIIIDPLSKGDRNNENTVYDKVQAVLWQHGYVLQTAAKDKTSGILSVKDHFVGANKEPSLFVFDDMPRTIYELEGYMYDKETQKPCVVGSTVIDTPSGSFPIKDLIGKELYVYSYSNEKQRLDVQWAYDIRKTGIQKEIWKLTCDNAILFATPDHLIMLRDGTYKELKDLNPYDSLMPLYRNVSADGYTKINPNDHRSKHGESYPSEHRFVYECVYGDIPEGFNLHHKDGNYLNHTPENLKLLTPREHRLFHINERISKVVCLRCGETFTQNMPWQKYCSKECREVYGNAHRQKRTRLKECLYCGKEYFGGRHKYCSISCRNNSFRDRRKQLPSYNHKVISVGFHGFEDVYNMEVKENHNFVANSIVVHNCDAEDHFCENLYRLMLLDTKWSELSYQDEGEEDSYIQNQGRDMIGGY